MSSFNSEKVNNISGIFNECINITYIDLSSFNGENINYMEKVFDNCLNLKEIKISKNFGEKIKGYINEKITKINYVE